MDNPYNSTFDPYGQDITILAPNGIDVITLPLQTVFQLQGMATHTGIMFGVQIGMVAILLLVLAMVTKQGKHRSLVFVLNVLSLIFIFTRNIMACFGVSGPFYNYYNWVAGYYEDVTQAKNLSIAVECMSFFVDLIIELSLMFQVRIVCCTLSSRWRSLITLASVLVVLMAVGARFALMVINIKDNISIVGQSTEEQWRRLNQVGSASNICLMISIIFFSLIFCLKLAHAIRQRRKMGIKQFGPMQIIFVMGCQTLIIPAIFGILSYVVLKNEQVNSFMPVVVAVFLPLSAVWASTNTNQNNIAAPYQFQGPAGMKGGSGAFGGRNGSTGRATDKQPLTTTFGTDIDTLVSSNAHDSALSSPIKETCTQVTACRGDELSDHELGLIGQQQIKVKRTVSVHSHSEV